MFVSLPSQSMKVTIQSETGAYEIEFWNIVDTNNYHLETMGVNFKD